MKEGALCERPFSFGPVPREREPYGVRTATFELQVQRRG